MPVVLAPLQDGSVVHVPAWVADNASFLRWVESEDAPESGKFGFFKGELWVDLTMERFFHNIIKMEIAFEIMAWVRRNNLGQYFGDGVLFSCPEIELSCEPDGLFVASESLKSEKVWFKSGMQSEVMYGAPDLVLEVISKSSVRKDTVTLRELYHQAGIREYWLVDSRSAEPVLQILRHTTAGYVSVRPQGGFVKSTVLGAKFMLVVDRDQETVRLERK